MENKKLTPIKKFIKTLVLFLIVVLFFLIKLPIFVITIIYNVFSPKKVKESSEYFYDNHNYDPRPWYLQYLDKGFGFMFTSSEKLQKPEAYVYDTQTKKKKFDFPFKWYLIIQFRRLFLLQKYLFINLLFHMWVVLFYKNYIKLYMYTYLTLLRFIFGERVIRNLDNDKQRIINIFTALIKKLFEQDEVLRQIKSDYNYKKKLKIIMLKYYKKARYFFLWYMRIIQIFLIKYFIKNIYIILIYLYYYIKYIYEVYNKFIKYFVRRKKQKTKKKEEDVKKDLAALFVYKPEIFKFYVTNSRDKDLTKILINIIMDSKNLKVDKDLKIHKKSKYLNNDWELKYKIHRIRLSMSYINAKNMSIKAFSNIKTYLNWIIYKYKFVEKIVFKKLMRKAIWTKDYERGFSVDVSWDIFLLADNVLYTYLEENIFIWEEPKNSDLTDLDQTYFSWSLINMPYRDFIDSFINRYKLTLFIKRHVLKTKRWLTAFDYDYLIYITKNFIDKDIMAFLYDNHYHYLLWTYETHKNINKNFKERFLAYLKKDFESMKISLEDLRAVLDPDNFVEFEDPFEDLKKAKYKKLKSKITTIIKEDLFVYTSYYENDFFKLRWIKFCGLKWFDFELYDEKLIKFSKSFFKQAIVKKLNVKMQSDIFYKLFMKNKELLSNIYNKEKMKGFFWSFSMSKKFDWITWKKKPLKYFKKLKILKKQKKLNTFVFIFRILRFTYFKDIKIKNLYTFKYVLEEWKRISFLKGDEKKKTIDIKVYNEKIDLLKIDFSRENLINYIRTMYKYNKLKGIAKAIVDILFVTIVFIIRKTIEYIKK